MELEPTDLARNDVPQRLRRRSPIRFGVAATAIGAIGLSTFGLGLPAFAAPGVVNTGYRTFGSCEKFLSYIRPLALEQVGPYGFGNGGIIAYDGGPVPVTEAAAAAAPGAKTASDASAGAGGTSSTNTQEIGVDEGDLVETDGRYVYTAIGNRLTVTDTQAAKLVATIALPQNGNGAELILDGARLAVVSGLYTTIGGETVVTVYDVANPAALRAIHTTHLEGQATATRSVDHRLRIVLSTSFGQRVAQKFPNPGPLNTPAAVKRATEANRKIVRTAPASDWLPRRFVEGASSSQGPIETALPCGQVGRPTDASGLGLTWVASVDLDRPGASPVVRGAAGVVANAGTTYASPDTLYVATQQWSPTLRRSPSSVTTEVHAFDLRVSDGARWIASGRFAGSILNQFSFSEHDGALRVASTRYDAGFGGTQVSGVQVMMLDNADHRKLKVVGEVWGLGTNEQIYAVRFVGPVGYVVTFRQIDPLYVLDLSDRLRPRVAGELKIPGYSAYLHPIGDGLLLGIGQDATEQGRRAGAQVSLFDVRDIAAPKRLATAPIGGQSAAEYDHKAFLWWAATRDVFLPSSTYDQRNGFPSFGVHVVRVGDRSAPALTERGVVGHDAKATKQVPVTTIPASNSATSPVLISPPFIAPQPVLRTLIVSGRVVTVSPLGLMVSDLGTLGEQAWVPFSL